MPSHRPLDDAGRADAHLANVVGALALDVMTGVAAAIERATGLSTVQASALSTLDNYASGGSTDQLSRAVGLSHSATVRLVDRLADAGHVERRATALDRRVSAVHLTAAGRLTVGLLRAARRESLQAVVCELSPAQRSSLAPLLDVLVARDVQPAPEGVAPSRYVCRLCDASACGHPDSCPVTSAVRGD